MSCIVMNDQCVKIMNGASYHKIKVNETGGKSKKIAIGSNDLFIKVYNAIICRIKTWLYGIKPGTKLSNGIGYRQSEISEDDISEAKNVPFSQIKTLLLKALIK